MLILYHNNLSSCSQKVRLALCLKNLEWNDRFIDLFSGENREEDFLKINPKGLVPVLEYDGKIITESSVINDYLNTHFEGVPLAPKSESDINNMNVWVNYVDQAIHSAVGAITLATVLRTAQMHRPREEVLAELSSLEEGPDKQFRLDIYQRGIESEYFSRALDTLAEFVQRLAKDLSTNDWLSGPNISLSDISVFPYVLRLKHLGFDFLFEQVNSGPVFDWMEIIKAKQAYQRAFTDYISHSDIEKMSVLASPYQAQVEELFNNNKRH
jgi:glutathione S-transferase